MRVTRVVMLVFLSLALPSEGGAQFQPRSALAEVVEGTSAHEAALLAFTRSQPTMCRGTVATAAIGGALFGALVGAVITLFGSVHATATSMGHKKFNGTPYVVGGAVLFGFLAANSWQRRCGMTDGAFP